MQLLYLEEHTSCNDYLSNFNAGFKFICLGRDDKIEPSSNQYNCLIFNVKGVSALTYQSQQFVLEANSVAFIPMLYPFEIEAHNRCELVIHYFNQPVEFCEKQTILQLSEYYSENIFTILPIKPTLGVFLNSLANVINMGVACKHFFEIKHQELFFYFRFFYTKQELAQLFSPILSNNIDFRTLVLSNYSNAKTVKDLASLCNYSLPTFNRQFRQTFNSSPLSWLHSRKMEQIQQKLMDKNIALTSIIDQFGFSSAGHFTSFCKKNLGYTPSSIRKLL